MQVIHTKVADFKSGKYVLTFFANLNKILAKIFEFTVSKMHI